MRMQPLHCVHVQDISLNNLVTPTVHLHKYFGRWSKFNQVPTNNMYYNLISWSWAQIVVQARYLRFVIRAKTFLKMLEMLARGGGRKELIFYFTKSLRHTTSAGTCRHPQADWEFLLCRWSKPLSWACDPTLRLAWIAEIAPETTQETFQICNSCKYQIDFSEILLPQKKRVSLLWITRKWREGYIYPRET
jgi:hypothetical protein